MRSIKPLGLLIMVGTSLVACSESQQSTAAGSDDAVPNTASPVPEADDLPAVITQSTQGIPNDGRNRREDARGPRRDGRFERRPNVDELEIRTYDGTGNNTQQVEWGASFSQLRRVAPAGYADGVASLAGATRPSARTISNLVATQDPGESIPNAFGITDFGWQWGQFVDHDLDLTDGSGDESADIQVPVGDPFFDPEATGDVVIPMSRALHDPDTGTGQNNPRQQENEITSWLDASMVYGSSEARMQALREGDTPFLKVSEGRLLPFNETGLANANGFIGDPTTLFLAGDIRVNEQVGLATLHTLFVREHNRLAGLLVQRDPDADGDELFERARRLLIATVQRITFEEYLPSLLGRNAIDDYDGYDASVDATIMNEFSAAAFRLGHSMVNDTLLRLDANGNPIDLGPLELSSAFFTAPRLLTNETAIDPVLRGLATQAHQAIDIKVNHTLRNFLFGQPGSGGFDLVALNIQRGRDHGLASYNDTREALGLERVTSFADITSDPTLQQQLADSYGSVDDIDLWVGGLAEDPLSRAGAQLGATFHRIVSRQFESLRDGDRFWYERTLTDDERDLLDNVTLADVIRNNTGIGAELQDRVFQVPDQP